MADFRDEVVECVLAKMRAGDVPRDIIRAAAAEQPISPAVKAWVGAVIRDTGTAGSEISDELERRYDRDEIFRRRIEPDSQQIAQRIIEIMVERELERHVQAGEVVARIGDDGETYYERADD